MQNLLCFLSFVLTGTLVYGQSVQFAPANDSDYDFVLDKPVQKTTYLEITAFFDGPYAFGYGVEENERAFNYRVSFELYARIESQEEFVGQYELQLQNIHPDQRFYRKVNTCGSLTGYKLKHIKVEDVQPGGSQVDREMVQLKLALVKPSSPLFAQQYNQPVQMKTTEQPHEQIGWRGSPAQAEVDLIFGSEKYRASGMHKTVDVDKRQTALVRYWDLNDRLLAEHSVTAEDHKDMQDHSFTQTVELDQVQRTMVIPVATSFQFELHAEEETKGRLELYKAESTPEVQRNWDFEMEANTAMGFDEFELQPGAYFFVQREGDPVQLELTYNLRIGAVQYHDQDSVVRRYDRDGRERFSQTPSQIKTNTFAYKNYDVHGHVIEEGFGQGDMDVLDVQDAFLLSSAKSYTASYGKIYTEIHYWRQAQQFVNDRLSRLCEYHDNGDSTETYYSYYPNGDLAWEVKRLMKGLTFTLSYVYNGKGRLIEVRGNEGRSDAFFQRYTYAQDQVATVETSQDGLYWEREARYLKRKGGKWLRTELGADLIQGVDYRLGKSGEIIGINHERLSIQGDLGKDGKSATDVQAFPQDVFGATVHPDYRVSTLKDQGAGLFQEGVSLKEKRTLDYKSRVLSASYAHLDSTGKWEDLNAQWSSNYVYDASGNVIAQEEYALDGTLTGLNNTTDCAEQQIWKDREGRIVRLENPCKKEVTFYVRDVQGKVRAVYRLADEVLTLDYVPILGKEKIGVMRFDKPVAHVVAGEFLPVQATYVQNAGTIPEVVYNNPTPNAISGIRIGDLLTLDGAQLDAKVQTTDAEGNVKWTYVQGKFWGNKVWGCLFDAEGRLQSQIELNDRNRQPYLIRCVRNKREMHYLALVEQKGRRIQTYKVQNGQLKPKASLHIPDEVSGNLCGDATLVEDVFMESAYLFVSIFDKTSGQVVPLQYKWTVEGAQAVPVKGPGYFSNSVDGPQRMCITEDGAFLVLHEDGQRVGFFDGSSERKYRIALGASYTFGKVCELDEVYQEEVVFAVRESEPVATKHVVDFPNTVKTRRNLGSKQYAIRDEEGRVRVVVSDVKIPTNKGYEAEVVSAKNYYPLGREMPGTVLNPQVYPYKER